MQNSSLEKFIPGHYWEPYTFEVCCYFCKKILFETDSFDDLCNFRRKKRCSKCKKCHCPTECYLQEKKCSFCKEKPAMTYCNYCYGDRCESCVRYCENCEDTICKQCSRRCCHENCPFACLCEGCFFYCYNCDQVVCCRNRTCEKCGDDVIDCLAICDSCGTKICHECIVHETWQCRDCSEYGDIEGSQDFHIWGLYMDYYLEIVVLF